MRKNVTVLAKNPFDADVKTRLAQDLGVEQAKGVYARLLYQTLFSLLDKPEKETSLTLSLLSSRDREYFTEAFPEFEITHQASWGDLGEKIHHALQQAFQNGAQKAIVIGSDLPCIQWKCLNQAFEGINERNIALGPCVDGGYYLIGMQSPGVNVFQNIPWSTENVLGLTLEKVQAAGYQHYLLPECQDIDFQSDLRTWQASLTKVGNQD